MKLTSPRGHTSLEPELASNAERRPQQPGTSVLAFLTCISSLYQPTTYPLMTQRERERHNTSVPFALCLLTHQSVEGRVWVEGARVIKKMKTLLLIVCSVSTFSGTNGTYLYRSCKIKVVGFQWFPIIVNYAYICIWNWHCIIYYIPMKGEVPDNNLHFSPFLE